MLAPILYGCPICGDMIEWTRGTPVPLFCPKCGPDVEDDQKMVKFYLVPGEWIDGEVTTAPD